MRKVLVWVLVTVGIAALVRKLRRRHGPDEPETVLEPPPSPVATSDDPVEELRRKLASTREETGVDADAVEESLDERRIGVHEQGRAAIDEMQRSTEE
jgi:hypothetical protein